MAVQEEINHKQVALVQKGAKVSYHMLIKAIRAYQQHQKNKKLHPAIPQGKMSVKELAQKGQGMTSIDLDNQDLKKFDRVMRKYGVDYAIMTDKKTKPPTHTLFFKGKDGDAIDKAFSDLTTKVAKKEKRPSVLAELKKMIVLVANTARDKVKKKEHTR